MDKIVQTELSVEDPGDRLRQPEGRAGRVGRRLDRRGGRRPRDGAETNIGSSTPIDSSGENIGSDLRRKVDQRRGGVPRARSRRRTTATRRGRRRRCAIASNLTATEALQRTSIDEVATDLPTLLQQARRLQDERAAADFTLHPPAPQIDEVEAGLLHAAAQRADRPEHHLAALPRGITGIGFEIFHPGVVLPGALGRGRARHGALRVLGAADSAGRGSRSSCSAIMLFATDAHVPTPRRAGRRRADQPRGRGC